MQNTSHQPNTSASHGTSHVSLSDVQRIIDSALAHIPQQHGPVMQECVDEPHLNLDEQVDRMDEFTTASIRMFHSKYTKSAPAFELGVVWKEVADASLRMIDTMGRMILRVAEYTRVRMEEYMEILQTSHATFAVASGAGNARYYEGGRVGDVWGEGSAESMLRVSEFSNEHVLYAHNFMMAEQSLHTEPAGKSYTPFSRPIRRYLPIESDADFSHDAPAQEQAVENVSASASGYTPFARPIRRFSSPTYVRSRLSAVRTDRLLDEQMPQTSLSHQGDGNDGSRERGCVRKAFQIVFDRLFKIRLTLE